jgi:transcriptional pleiotropic repressor
MRKINRLQRKASVGDFSFPELSENLSEIMNANVYIIDEKGKLIADFYTKKSDTIVLAGKEKRISGETNEELLGIRKTRINVKGEEANFIFKEKPSTKIKYHMFIPIIVLDSERVGTIIISRYEKPFGDDDIIIGECAAMIIGHEIKRVRTEREKNEAREIHQVQKAIKTLSYSELLAIKKMLEEMGDLSGVFVTSKIADKLFITRSVIISAIRKLESADVIESRSLGMRGTYIKVLNKKLNECFQNHDVPQKP